MSSVKERPGKQTGPNVDEKGNSVYTNEYVAVTDTVQTGDFVKAMIGVPQYGTSHPDNSSAKVVSVVPSRQEDQRTWFVRVTWKTRSSSNEQQQGNPEDDPIKWRWDKIHYDDFAFADLDDKPFVDAAGTPFNPPPPIPRTRLKLVFTRNQLDFVPLVASGFGDKINSQEWFGVEAFAAKSDTPTAVEQERDAQSYWQVTYGVEVSADVISVDGVVKFRKLWKPLEVLNAGPREKKKFFDADGNLIGTKVVVSEDDQGVSWGGQTILTPDGFKIPFDDVIDDHNFIGFRNYDAVDFNQLVPYSHFAGSPGLPQ